MNDERQKLIAVAGPTASGKTSLGICLAKHYNGEIVSCDSMQIYKGLDIGTAKPTPREMAEVPHHMVGIVDVSEKFSVSDYVFAAENVINDITARQKLPIFVGGTGLYLRSLIQGISFEENPVDEELRKELALLAKTEGAAYLHKKLFETDSEAAKLIHENNVKRVVRALEYCHTTGKKFSAQMQSAKGQEKRYNAKVFCLSFRDRKKLYQRIEKRIDLMMEAGLLQEAKQLWREAEHMTDKPTALQAIGYKELFPYFQNQITLNTAISNLKQATRRYAKRQLTWFRKEDCVFVYADDYKNETELANAVFQMRTAEENQYDECENP